MLLADTEELREESSKFLESNESQNTGYENMWNTVKTVLRGTFIAMHAYIK
jgi:hypothetical protein